MLINIKNRVNNHSDELTKQQQTEIKNILINEKNFKDIMIFLNRYVNSKSIKMSRLYFLQINGKN